jgi:hypothetical protein
MSDSRFATPQIHSWDTMNWGLGILDPYIRITEVYDRVEEIVMSSDSEDDELYSLLHLLMQVREHITLPDQCEDYLLVNVYDIDKYTINDQWEMFEQEIMRLPEHIRAHIDWNSITDSLYGGSPVIKFAGTKYYLIES